MKFPCSTHELISTSLIVTTALMPYALTIMQEMDIHYLSKGPLGPCTEHTYSFGPSLSWPTFSFLRFNQSLEVNSVNELDPGLSQKTRSP